MRAGGRDSHGEKEERAGRRRKEEREGRGGGRKGLSSSPGKEEELNSASHPRQLFHVFTHFRGQVAGLSLPQR